MTRTAADARPRHLLVAVMRDGKVENHLVFDASAEMQPLVSGELAYRAVAAHPGRAGEPFVPGLAQTPTGVEFTAYSATEKGTEIALASVEVPVAAFRSIAAGLAEASGMKGEYQYVAAVCDPEAPLVKDWSGSFGEIEGGCAEGGANVEWVVEGEASRFALPTGFSSGPFPRTHVVDPAGTWQRCVFTRSAYREFLDAAVAERQRERAWIAVGDVHVAPDACRTVLRRFVELPAESYGRAFVKTRGRDFLKFHRELGADRMAAFAHLHPRSVDTTPLTPSPSGDDLVVFCDFSSASTLLPVFPIALFGATSTDDLAAHAFVSGVMTPIQIEILP